MAFFNSSSFSSLFSLWSPGEIYDRYEINGTNTKISLSRLQVRFFSPLRTVLNVFLVGCSQFYPPDILTAEPNFVSYLVADSSEKDGSVSVALTTRPSQCDTTGLLRVSITIQNVVSSWENYFRDRGSFWFECVSGPSVCSSTNPSFSLASTAGLTFIYEPKFM